MTKPKKQILVPIIIIGSLLAYCWIIILATDVTATWRHYVGMILFIGLILQFFKSISKANIATGIYLLLATFNGLAITPEINTSWLAIGPLVTPPVQILSMGLFILYFIINLDPLIDIYLEYKESKNSKVEKGI